MKSITVFLFLFIIKSSISTMSIDAFSINPFIDMLKHEELFDIIKSSKEAYGEEFSIIFCEELNKNRCGHCKRLVKEYLPPSPIDRNNPKDGYTKGISTNVRPVGLRIKKYDYVKIKKPKYNWDNFNEILNAKYPPEEAKRIIDNIIRRVQHTL